MSVTAPKGFVASGVHCGIKSDPAALDLALVATQDGEPVPAAAVFTSNLATAAPVNVSKAHLTATAGRATAVVLNSGNANAATGAQGDNDAERTAVLVAQELGCRPENILICSTGLIGIPLPMPALEGGIKPLTSSLSPDAADAAADAILTTDTARKTVSVDAPGFTVGGMAKGAAMLAPNMATMLAVLTTDAAVEPPALQQALAGATSASFNEITVDGCTSTNDTVIVLASGKRSVPDPTTFTEVLTAACAGLARQMVADAEGATKFATVTVTGATTDDEARQAARKVAESQLVKCSLYGADPYWGRILSELGSAGVAFDPSRVTIAYGDITVCAGGVAAAHDTAAVKAHLTTERDVRLSADLGLGAGRATVLTSDLTHAYIDENMRTS